MEMAQHCQDKVTRLHFQLFVLYVLKESSLPQCKQFNQTQIQSFISSSNAFAQKLRSSNDNALDQDFDEIYSNSTNFIHQIALTACLVKFEMK